jgi:predicted metal-dependent phosphoesterase TrpH
MPAQEPFTRLCQTLASRGGARVDLHTHTVHSDGSYTPAEIVDLARRSGLPALAITDHDTLEGIAPARAAAAGALEIVAGVEITARHRDREFHLLGYFFREDDQALRKALSGLCQARQQRFGDIVAGLRRRGMTVNTNGVEDEGRVLGRRHIAQALIESRYVRSEREAFARYLGDDLPLDAAEVGLPVAEAIALVRGAGGVAAWAHPTYDCTRESLIELRGLGLQALEAEYPGWRRSRIGQLRAWARELGFAVTGGSDCHGPGPRAVGAAGIMVEELERLRERAES